MKKLHTAYVAVGANLGDRASNISKAIEQLRAHPHIDVQRVSTVIDTDPVGLPGQPRYLNAAIELTTTLQPRELLDALLEIERNSGRDREREGRWGARTLDLDLLLYEKTVIREQGLTVPHPRLHERSFVLIPLAEIAPDAWHPVLEQPVQSLLDHLTMADSTE